MTGRVCPVHGEYAADGVCRWCEPGDAVQMEYVSPTAHPPSRYWPVKGVTRDELVETFGEPEPVIEVATWRTPPANEGWEEIRIDAQHAALRWERVARRWEAKHLYTLLDVAKQWQTKWRFELKQALKILERHNPLLQDAPWKEPKP